MSLSGLLFVGVTGIVRHIGSGLPPIEAAFIRYCFGLIVLLPVFLRLQNKWPKGKKLGLFALRGIAHAIAVSLWFYAMARIPITEVIAIGYTTPIYVAIGAALFLGERFRIHRLMAILAGFVGTLIILRPGLHPLEAGSIAQLLAALFFAGSFILAKTLTRSENPVSIIVWLTVFCVLALLPGAIAQWLTPTPMQLFWLAVVATLASFAHYCQTRAIEVAPITATQPAWFMQIVWGALMGWFIFGEGIDTWVMAGAALIIISVMYITHREMQANKPSS